MKESSAPFTIDGKWARFALGYGALWFTLILLTDAGGGELAAGLALLCAGAITIVAIDSVTQNLGLAVKTK